MSSDSIRGNLYVGDIGALEPFEGQDRLLELFRQFLVWHGQREPVVPGDPFTKFATKGWLVDIGLVSETTVRGDDDDPGEDPTEIDDPRVYAYARDFQPSSSGGCGAMTTLALGSGMPDVMALPFDSATNESAQTQLILPPEWPGKSFQVRIYWSHPLATSWGVAWEVQAHAATDSEPMNVSYVTGVIAEDVGGVTNELYISASNVVTIDTGQALPGDLCFIKVIRRTDLGADTLNADAYLHAIEFRVGNSPADFPPPLSTTMTWDSANKHASVTLSNGDLTSTAAAFQQAVRATVGKSSGKWYFEITFDTSVSLGTAGIIKSTDGYSIFVGETATSYGRGTDKKYNGSSTTVLNDLGDGDVLMVAVDLDAGKIWFGNNGIWDDLGDPAGGTTESFSGLSGTYYPASSPYGSTSGQHTINSVFVYSPPSGFAAWT